MTIATAGNTSSGHIAVPRRSPKATGLKYRHVTYDGGNPAVIATVGGETQVTTQLASEQAEMIKGKRLAAAGRRRAKPLGDRRVRHDPADHQLDQEALLGGHRVSASVIPKGVPSGSRRDCREGLERAHLEIREARVCQSALGDCSRRWRQGGLRRGLADRRDRLVDHQRRRHGEGLARRSSASRETVKRTGRYPICRADLRVRSSADRVRRGSARRFVADGPAGGPAHQSLVALPALMPGVLGALMIACRRCARQSLIGPPRRVHRSRDAASAYRARRWLCSVALATPPGWLATDCRFG